MRALVGLAVLVLALAACSGDDSSTAPTVPPPTTAAHTPDSVYDLAVSDCFNGLGEDQDLRIRIVACGRRHQAEVYGVVNLDNRRFPGADVIRRQVATQCAQFFAGYTGAPAGIGTDLAFTEVVPTLASFSAGDRRGLCVALGVGGAPLHGSIAQRGHA